MDLRTSASTEVAGAKQPEIPLPPVHIVLDVDPQSVTPGGDLRYAWRVTSASVTADPLTPSSITEGMRVEVDAIDHLAGSAVVDGARAVLGGDAWRRPPRSTAGPRARWSSRSARRSATSPCPSRKRRSDAARAGRRRASSMPRARGSRRPTPSPSPLP